MSMNAYEKRERERKAKIHARKKLTTDRTTQERAYAVDNILREHEAVSDDKVSFANGWFVVEVRGAHLRFRREAFVNRVREPDAAKHEESLLNGIDNS